MSPELRTALIDALDTLDTYLMANWDEHARKRVRANFAKVRKIMVDEEKHEALVEYAREPG